MSDCLFMSIWFCWASLLRLSCSLCLCLSLSIRAWSAGLDTTGTAEIRWSRLWDMSGLGCGGMMVGGVGIGIGLGVGAGGCGITCLGGLDTGGGATEETRTGPDNALRAFSRVSSSSFSFLLSCSCRLRSRSLRSLCCLASSCCSLSPLSLASFSLAAFRKASNVSLVDTFLGPAE